MMRGRKLLGKISVENFRGINMGKIQQQYIINEKGQKTAVVLPFEEYEELLQDIQDLAIIAERRDGPAISFDELKKRLKEYGSFNLSI